MSINDLLGKIKPFYTIILLIVLSTIFYGFWRISAIQESREPLKIEYKNSNKTANAIYSGVEDSGEVIGSKSGKKYYFPWCGTVKRIKPENQVKFSSIEEAKKAGFTPGGNCKGLK